MGEDEFGTKRGMCALCECNEYLKPSNDSQNCDFCDHKPVKHIEIIQLGACICNDCDGYTSPTLSKASVCEYCGCPAPNHKGWDQIQRQIEKIKTRIAKPTGAIGSVVTKDILSQLSTPQPSVPYGGFMSYNNPSTQPFYADQAQYTKQQSQPLFSQKPKLQIHPYVQKSDAFEKYNELEKFQREVRNAKSQVRAKFEFYRNCLNSIENEKICELDVISEKYEELFSYHQANLLEMEIVKSRMSKFKEADLQPALKKITSTLDNNKKMIEKSNIKIPDNFVTWNDSSFEKTLQKLCNIVDVECLKGPDFKQLPIDNAPLYTYTPHPSCTNEHGFTNVTEYLLGDKNSNPYEHRLQKKN